jgi:hypothetical protein
MPAHAGTAFNWVRVSGGVWTRIWSGPLVTGLPFQGLELAAFGPTPGRTLTWTLDGYSPLAPYYNRSAGTTRVFFAGAPPVGHLGPSSWAAVLWFTPSPWADFLILTNAPCFAHITLV